MPKFMNLTKVVTGVCTFSYLNCWDAKAINGGTPKFSVSLIISKSDTKTVEKIKAAIQAAYEEGQSKTYIRILEFMPGISLQDFNGILQQTGIKELGSTVKDDSD